MNEGPLQERGVHSTMIAGDTQRQGAGLRRLLLLVEDTEDDGRLALRAIEGYRPDLEVLWAKDGEEALIVLGLVEEPNPPRTTPDLIICDVKMPRVGGIEVLREIRGTEELSNIPVVMFSTSTHDFDVRRCMELGASDYCYKPFDPREFADCVRAIVDRWLSSQTPEPTPDCLVETAVET